MTRLSRCRASAAVDDLLGTAAVGRAAGQQRVGDRAERVDRRARVGVLAAQHLRGDPGGVGVVYARVAERLASHAEVPDHRAQARVEEDRVRSDLTGRLALADRVVERVRDAQQEGQRAGRRELRDAAVLRQRHGGADVVCHVEPAVEVAGGDERQQAVAGQLGALGGGGREPHPAVVLGGSAGHTQADRLVQEVDDRVVTVSGRRQTLDRLGDQRLVGRRAVCGRSRLVHQPESEKTWGVSGWVGGATVGCCCCCCCCCGAV
jgi:hypothetical protein